MAKKALALMIAVTILISPLQAFGAPAGFSGGVHNEYEYEEIVFITGKPMKFSGELKISESGRNDTKTVTYKFNLTNKEETTKTKLTRTVSFVTEYNQRQDKGQATTDINLRRYSEKIEIDGDKYELKDYQFSKSDVIDKRPASDFYSGNMKGRKVYEINRDEGEIIVNFSGGEVGYENFWGSTQTQIIDYYITSERIVADEEGKLTKLTGKALRAQVSDSMTKKLTYDENEANFSSFYGGYIRTTNREWFHNTSMIFLVLMTTFLKKATLKG